MPDVLNRFLRYVKINTTSQEGSSQCPSFEGEWDLAKLLRDELQAMGAQDVLLDEHAYVYARIPKTVENAPTIALIAHMDTADAVPGRGFNPRVVHFTGEDIKLNEDHTLSLKAFPNLSRYIGEDLVVTDGTTVLGADDKAGIAEIMTAAQTLLQNPQIPHGDVMICFTPDEEIGSGAELLNLDILNADYGFTVDGGDLDEIECENFNASGADVHFTGSNFHPGYAKNRMRNAIKMAIEFNRFLPPEQAPEHTEGREGFYHLSSLSGNVENAIAHYLIREFDEEKFKKRNQLLMEIAEYMNRQIGFEAVRIEFKDRYYNMLDILKKHPEVLLKAENALKRSGFIPRYVPIRGGTDGAHLSRRGLPCPNLGTGSENIHSVYEYIAVSQMEKMSEVLVEIVRA